MTARFRCVADDYAHDKVSRHFNSTQSFKKVDFYQTSVVYGASSTPAKKGIRQSVGEVLQVSTGQCCAAVGSAANGGAAGAGALVGTLSPKGSIRPKLSPDCHQR